MFEKELEKYPDLMSPMEIAELFQCSETFVRKEINANKLKALKISRKFRVPKKYLAEYLQNTQFN